MSASNVGETAERFVPAIEELGALADQPIQISGTDRAPLVAVGLYYHLVNQVAALMLLRSSRFDRACAPLRRSLIEHMLYLIWLADAMNRGLQHQQRHLGDIITAAGVPVPTVEQRAILDRTIDTAVPTSDQEHLLHMAHLPDAYPLSPLLKSIWQVESGWAHPSLHVMQLYVEQQPDATVLHISSPASSSSPATRPSLASWRCTSPPWRWTLCWTTHGPSNWPRSPSGTTCRRRCRTARGRRSRHARSIAGKVHSAARQLWRLQISYTSVRTSASTSSQRETRWV
jgi:hypothetical protein